VAGEDKTKGGRSQSNWSHPEAEEDMTQRLKDQPTVGIEVGLLLV
jgi:hypothetical protein